MEAMEGHDHSSEMDNGMFIQAELVGWMDNSDNRTRRGSDGNCGKEAFLSRQCWVWELCWLPWQGRRPCCSLGGGAVASGLSHAPLWRSWWEWLCPSKAPVLKSNHQQNLSSSADERSQCPEEVASPSIVQTPQVSAFTLCFQLLEPWRTNFYYW